MVRNDFNLVKAKLQKVLLLRVNLFESASARSLQSLENGSSRVDASVKDNVFMESPALSWAYHQEFLNTRKFVRWTIASWVYFSFLAYTTNLDYKPAWLQSTIGDNLLSMPLFLTYQGQAGRWTETVNLTGKDYSDVDAWSGDHNYFLPPFRSSGVSIKNWTLFIYWVFYLYAVLGFLWTTYAVVVIFSSWRYAKRKEGQFEDVFVRAVVSTKDLKARSSKKITERAVASADSTGAAVMKAVHH